MKLGEFVVARFRTARGLLVRVLKRLRKSERVARAIRALTRMTVLPWSMRVTIHRRAGKPIHLQDRPPFEVHSPLGPPVRLHHGPTADYLWWLGAYEPAATDLFCRLAVGASLILDVGARDGVYTLFAASSSHRASVLAFEPDPEAARLLRANVALNAHLDTGRITIFEVALGADDTSAEFYLAGGNSSLNPSFRPGSKPIPVPVRRGDSVLAELALGVSVGLVKVDTESTEPDVLLGLEQTVARDRPVILCEVLAGRTEERLQAFTQRHDYVVWRLGDKGLERIRCVLADRTYRNLNLLFTPAEWSVPAGIRCR